MFRSEPAALAFINDRKASIFTRFLEDEDAGVPYAANM
jgi:hypothetical protein